MLILRKRAQRVQGFKLCSKSLKLSITHNYQVQMIDYTDTKLQIQSSRFIKWSLLFQYFCRPNLD